MTLLLRIEPRQAVATWPRIKDRVAVACARSSGRFLPEDVLRYAVEGHMQLWAVIDEDGSICAIAGTTFVNYPQLKALRIHFGTGTGRKKWQHHLEDIVAWGKAQGAALTEGDFRVGWTRVFRGLGWKQTHVFLERIN